MKKFESTGHIDYIGRVVIPKFIRQELQLKETDKVEIYLNENDEIIIRKVEDN